MSENPETQLRRVLSLPWLVFYGVGVTIGAGIFALIAEIVGVAGDHAPWAFIAAGVVAGFSALSFAALSSAYPKAAGEVIYIKHGIGALAGRLAGYGLVVSAMFSGAVIALAFARYAASFSGLPEAATLAAVLAVLAAIAVIGVRESVAFAALITLLEAGTLIVIIAVGLPQAVQSPVFAAALSPPTTFPGVEAVLAGGFVAFFAFIGFENIVNMAEETHDASAAVPKAILLTLVISVTIYALVALVAAAYPDRDALVASKAPLVLLFEGATGLSGTGVAVMASVAMVNGILVQIIMASRVLYGMAREGMVPSFLGSVHEGRKTPVAGILLITGLILVLALAFPLLQLAEVTSFVILSIFTAVNLSLFLIGGRADAQPHVRRWRWWGLVGAAASFGLAVSELAA